MTGMTMDYTALMPEIILLGSSVVVLLAGSFLARARQYVTRWFALAALIATAAVGYADIAGGPEAIFAGTYTLDAPTAVVRIAAPLATAVAILIGRREFDRTARESETYSLLLLATLGTVVIGGTTDLLVLIAGYLLGSIPLYALIGLSRSGPAAEATLKTYLAGALFGVLLMAGVAVLTGLAGNTTYPGLAAKLVGAPAIAVAAGSVAVLIGLMFKAGAVPGHFWIPDASQAAGPAIAGYLTTVPKIGALIAIARLAAIMPASINMPLLIAVLAAVSMSVGNLAALAQTNVRRLLGWSTISQVGYLLMPIAVITSSYDARPALLAYIVFYALTNLALFAVVACFPRRDDLDDWHGLARAHPWLTGSLIVGALSLVGTPPTAVFLGKVAVFTVTWDGGMAWLVVLAAVNTVLSLFYYLRLFLPTFRPAETGEKSITDVDTREAAPGVAATTITLAAGVLAAGAIAAALLALGTGTLQ